MPSIGPRCHELRLNDENRTWRIFHRVDEDAILVVLITDKTTRATPKRVIDLCRARLTAYDATSEESGGS
jgi:phage-related protein